MITRNFKVIILNLILALSLLSPNISAAAGFQFGGIRHDLTTTATAAGTTTLTSASFQVQRFTGATTQSVVLPVGATLKPGYWYVVSNDSTGIVTVFDSAAVELAQVAAGTSATFYLVTAANPGTWDVQQSGGGAGATDATDLTYTPTTPADWLSVPTDGQEALDNLAAQRPVINLMTEGVAYTPTFTGLGTVSSVDAKYSRNGNVMEIWGSATAGTPTAVPFSITLPTGLTIDTTQVVANKSPQGMVQGLWSTNTWSSAGHTQVAFYDGSDATKLFTSYNATGGSYVKGNGNDFLTAGNTINFRIHVPIAEWAQSTTVDIFEAGDFGPTAFTPTTTNFGGNSAESCYYSRSGSFMDINCRFTATNPAASVASVTIPGGQSISSSAGTLSRVVGSWQDNSGLTGDLATIIDPSTSATQIYFSITSGTYAGLAKRNANQLVGAGAPLAFTARIPIEGWSTFPLGVATGGTGSAEAVTKSITQTAHGFTVGEVVYYTGTAYDEASAATEAQAEVVGIVSAVADANTFTLLTHGEVTGLTGLTAGTTYFLDASTPGALTATAPASAGQISKPVLLATSTTTGNFQNYRGLVVASASDDSTLVTAQYHLSANSAPGANNPFIFGAERWDTHGAYNISTGEFTAPLAGKYQVSIAGAITSSGAYNHIYVNGVKRVHLMHTTTTQVVGSSVGVDLAAGDVLTIRPNGAVTLEFSSGNYDATVTVSRLRD